MRPEAKRLKIVSIITMFVGIIFFILGIVLTVRGAGLGGVAAIVSGALGAFVGVRGSLIANVPSTSGKIVLPAVLCAVVGLVLCAVCFFMGDDQPSSILGSVVPAVFCCCVGLLGRALAKELEKV